jgi:hypothetical protein
MPSTSRSSNQNFAHIFFSPMRNLKPRFTIWGNGAGVAQSVYWLGYGLDERGSFPGGGRFFIFSPPRPRRVWGPPASYQMGNGGCILEAKATGVWSWQLSFI